jgi:hypothetical protein
VKVFLLWHIHEFPEGTEDAKLIGVYSSSELAEEAQHRALKQSGFRESPTGFCIDCYNVDTDYWREVYRAPKMRPPRAVANGTTHPLNGVHSPPPAARPQPREGRAAGGGE